MAMSRFFYSLLLYLLMPLVLLYLAGRSLKERAYRQRWKERFGFGTRQLPSQPVWLHAASVGEVQAAAPLVRALQRERPDLPLLITTTTPAGSGRVRALFGESVGHCYLPFDLPGAVRRFLRQVRPRLAIVMETELWPNLFHALAARRTPILIANARLSPGSLKRYRRLPRLIRATLACVDTIAAQSPRDAERYAALGAEPRQLVTTGNVKFDLALPVGLRGQGRALRADFGRERPVWIAASTHGGEEELVLAAHRRLLERWSRLLLVLVPRHPDRFERVAELCRAEGFALACRSRGEPAAAAQVYLGDTMGELMMLYAASDVAFVGGSLVPVGGHNLLEPAALGLAPLSGPQLFNFEEIAQLLKEARALTVVEDAAALAEQVAALLADAEARLAAGARARQVVEENRGALGRTLELVDALLRQT